MVGSGLAILLSSKNVTDERYTELLQECKEAALEACDRKAFLAA